MILEKQVYVVRSTKDLRQRRNVVVLAAVKDLRNQEKPSLSRF
jgi:hypothetical protein